MIDGVGTVNSFVFWLWLNIDLEAASKFSFFQWKKHKTCVKFTALESLEKARFVPKEKAIEIVNKVFDKCYLDLEPIGRRPIDKKDMKRAYNERYLCEN